MVFIEIGPSFAQRWIIITELLLFRDADFLDLGVVLVAFACVFLEVIP